MVKVFSVCLAGRFPEEKVNGTVKKVVPRRTVFSESFPERRNKTAFAIYPRTKMFGIIDEMESVLSRTFQPKLTYQHRRVLDFNLDRTKALNLPYAINEKNRLNLSVKVSRIC